MIDERLWRECLSALRQRPPGMVEGNRVLLVDFNALKIQPDQKEDTDHIHMDDVEGANDLEAKHIRRHFGTKVLLLDGNLHPRCWPFVLYHEAQERRDMSRGMSYDKAHDRANDAERELRIRHRGQR